MKFTTTEHITHNFMYSWEQCQQLPYDTWPILLHTWATIWGEHLFEWDVLRGHGSTIGIILYDKKLYQFKVYKFEREWKDIEIDYKSWVALNRILLKHKKAYRMVNIFQNGINNERIETGKKLETIEQWLTKHIASLRQAKKLLQESLDATKTALDFVKKNSYTLREDSYDYYDIY